jgi:2-C-methyl-D-erythritol 4-phosphate cytidylyltransferase
VTDTIKEARDGRVLRTLDRSGLWAIQTPQAFRRAVLERALDQPDEILAAATDDALLVEAQGGSVRVVPAPRENVKVTTALDLRLAELLLGDRPAAG